MRLSGWLFVRGSETIWVVRPQGRSMIVAGPGPHREQRDFIDESTLNQFQIQLAERLTGEGWLLWPKDDDRRSGQERRGTRRGVPDRRGDVAEAS